MKQITYPTRLTVPVDGESGAMLDSIAKNELRTRASVLIRALRFYFNQNYKCNSSKSNKGVKQ